MNESLDGSRSKKTAKASDRRDKSPDSREQPSGNRTITRAHLAEAVQKKLNVARGDAAELVETVLSEIFEAVVAKENVKLSTFGVFQVRAKKERKGRNPKTGADAKISARFVVTFKPSNLLRERIRNGDGNAPTQTRDG